MPFELVLDPQHSITEDTEFLVRHFQSMLSAAMLLKPMTEEFRVAYVQITDRTIAQLMAFRESLKE